MNRIVRPKDVASASKWFAGPSGLDPAGGEISEVERLLCNPAPIGSIEELVPRVNDAWSVRFPDLRSLGPVPVGGRKLRFCIATEDIAGPVRNGGIGTTYAALAELIAELGHECTILYLKGREVETGDIDHWIDAYAAKGVRLTPVPNYAVQDDVRTHADRWLRAPYNMLRFLLEHPMDVVHVSEWRGSAYLSLLAKRQGLAFADTLFIVKTSSPWLWNRLYGSQPLERIDDLAKVHAERRSVELADMVVGGSLHLLRWMGSQGYRIPRERTFVQPNVVRVDGLRDLSAKRANAAGSRIPVDEIVFFGRLEARKGLFVFCQAVRRLIRLGVPLPSRISFMGKPGARLTARPDQTILEYLDVETRSWPTDIQILTEFQQYEALDYLLSGRRLAVMPSVIENSSLAVYEAAICGIPFVASDVGGNAELLAVEDRGQVLCQPHPLHLADKLAEALTLGGYVPRPSFDNESNLDTWRWFHDALGSGLLERVLKSAAGPAHASNGPVSVAACVYFSGDDDSLRATLTSLFEQHARPQEVIVCVDAEDGEAGGRAEAIAAALTLPIVLIDADDLDMGAAFNAAAEAASADFLLFLKEGCTVRAEALRVLASVAQASGADLLNYFHRVTPDDGDPDGRSPLKAWVIGSPADGYFGTDVTFMPLFVRRQSFEDLKGFTTDYRVLGQDYEFVGKAQLAGHRCETALLDLGAVPAWSPHWLARKGYDAAVGNFRLIRPHLAAAPLGLRDLLLTSKGLQARPGGPARRSQTSPADPVDGRFTRMMQALLSDPPRTAQPRPVTKPKSGPEPNSAAAMLRSIDDHQPSGSTSAAPRTPPGWSRPGLVRAGDLMGQALFVRDGGLHGWAADQANPGLRLSLELEIDGRRRQLRADRDLPLAGEAPARTQGHGFIVPLPLAGWLGRRDRPRRVRLRFAGSDVILFNQIVPVAESATEGWCDPSDVGLINGWAWTPSNPGAHVDVAVFLDGRFLTRVEAASDREDLRLSGVGDGAYGFSVAVPKAFRDGAVRRVDVLMADTGEPLMRSPMTLSGRTLALPSRQPRRQVS